MPDEELKKDRSRNRARDAGRRRWAWRLLCLIITAATAATAAADRTPAVPELRVLHILTSGVYLDAGDGLGLQKGDRFLIERDGEPVAELEVVHVSADKTACQILELHRPIEIGDRAVPVRSPEESGAVPKPQRAPPSKGSTLPPPRLPGAAEPGEGTTGNRPGSAVVDRTRRGAESITLSTTPWAETSGSVSARIHHFGDSSPAGRDFSQNTMQLNLRLKEIGGRPLSMRVRMRGRENERTQSDGSTLSDRRDRLYELSLSYEQPDGRYSFQLGRLRSGPLVGFDYLDGALGEVKVANRVSVGGFYGNRPVLDEISFESTGSTYGAFVHYRKKRKRDSPFYADMLLGAIGERGKSGEINREYLSLYSRIGSGSQWSLYGRAEVDLNRDWRQQVAGDSYQISNLLLSGNYRFSNSFRLGVSYDLRRRYLDLDDRDTPEEVFDDRLRDGLRFTFYIGDSRGWRAITSIGSRRLQSTGESTDAFNGSIYNANVAGKDLLLGVDFSGYSGPASDGLRVSLRGRKYFSGGHDVGLVIGSSEATAGSLAETRKNQWVRLTGTARLPRGFFVVWEVEQSDGDDFEGLRTVLQLGIRF